jgi:hypothetical protein
MRRLLKYFARPRSINMLKFAKVMELGKRASLLYPREGENEVYIDNRKLDGFIDRFVGESCQDIVCEECRYCHEWAQRTVVISQGFEKDMKRIYGGLLDDIHSGAFWEDYGETIRRAALEAAEGIRRDGILTALVGRPADGIRRIFDMLPSTPWSSGAKSAGAEPARLDGEEIAGDGERARQAARAEEKSSSAVEFPSAMA